MEHSISPGHSPPAWHICWQAVAGRSFVADSRLAAKVTDRLLQAHRSDGRVLLHYLLTPAEVHVVSRLSAGITPRHVVREVAAVIARWVREAQGLRGPVFASRYREHAISTEVELKHEIRMLAWRPVAAGLCAAPLHYVNSSLRTTLGLRRAHGFDSRALLSVFDDTVIEARSAIRRLIRPQPLEAEIREWELNHGLSVAVGSAGPSFGIVREVGGAAAKIVAAAPTQDIDGALRLLEQWVTHRLAMPSEPGLAVLRDPAGARARALVARLAVQSNLCSAAAVARHFCRSRATLCEQMATSRMNEQDRQLLGMPMQLILDELAKLTGSGRLRPSSGERG